MNSLQLSEGPATLNDSDLKTPKVKCPCAESLCDCCAQIESRLRQIREESSLLKQQLEALSVNHEMRSAAVVATLLHWIDDDAAKLKMKNCCCHHNREAWPSYHMAEGSLRPVYHSTPANNKSMPISVPEVKRDAMASHVESLKLSTPSMPVGSTTNSSFFQGLSAGSSNVFLDDSSCNSHGSSYGSNRLSDQNSVPLSSNSRSKSIDSSKKREKSQDLLLSDLEYSSKSNVSASVSAKTSSNIRTPDPQQASSGSKPKVDVSGSATKTHTSVSREPQQDNRQEQTSTATFQTSTTPDVLRSSSAPPEIAKPSIIHPQAFHSQPLEPCPRPTAPIPPVSDQFSSSRASYKSSTSSGHSQRYGVPPTISEVPRNPTSVHQPIAVKPNPSYNLGQGAFAADSRRTSDHFRNVDKQPSQVKTDYSGSSIGGSANGSGSTLCGGQVSEPWRTGKNYSGHMRTPSATGQNSHVGQNPLSRESRGSTGKSRSNNANNEHLLENKEQRHSRVTPPQENEKQSEARNRSGHSIARNLMSDFRNDDPQPAVGTTAENTQRSPSRSPQTIQSDFGSVAELEEFVMKLISNRRLLGEIAFQLDRRILNYIFNSRRDKKRFYGYTIPNIPEKIAQESRDHVTGGCDERKHALLHYRYEYVQNLLRPLGYDIKRHGETAEVLVNCYGLLPTPSNKTLQYHFTPSNSRSVWAIVEKLSPITVLPDMQILFDCLLQFSKDDGKPMIMW